MTRRVLRVVRKSDGDVVHRVDVEGKSDREVEKVMRGMLRNMSEDYRVEDSADDDRIQA